MSISLLKSLLRIVLGLFILGGIISLSSCSTHRNVPKRGQYERKHHNRRDRKDKGNKEDEKTVSDLVKHLKGDEKKVIKEAETWIGTPYKYGGEQKGKEADCSGFVMRVYKDAIDCSLPRNSAKQYEFCKKIKRHNVKPGDLVFFATGSDPNLVSHVGIMVDDKRFLHTSSSKGVILSTLDSDYFAKRLIGFGKVACMNH